MRTERGHINCLFITHVFLSYFETNTVKMGYKQHTFIVSCIFNLLTLATEVEAGDFQSLDEIRKTAGAFAAQQINGSAQHHRIETGYLDSRLHLPRCNRPLEVELLGQQRNTPNITVTIKCQGAKPWSVHVPVKVSIFAQIFVTNRPLPRGLAIQRTDLRQEQRDTSMLRNGYFENAEAVVGRIPKRSLPQGMAIAPSDLDLNRIIQRGSKVTIFASRGGISVNMPGKALADAAEGEVIKVENLSSKRVIEAVALRPGVVEVQM